MAKAAVRTKMASVRGISADALEQAKEQFESMTPIIEIPIRGGKVARFELVTVPADDIEAMTYVSDSNARNQSMLNPVSVSDIDPLIAMNGQQFPAIGQRNESTNGKIQVMDGSRRRFSCIRNNKTYYIYVTSDPITKADIRYLSNTANISKPLSLYEKGAAFEDLLNTGEYPDAKTLAEGEGENESTVSVALNAYLKIPFTVAVHVPSISDLGRTLIKQLIDMLTDSRLTPEQRTELSLCAKEDKFSLNALMEATSSSDPARLNSAFVAALRERYLQLLPKPQKKAPAPILASHGKTKAVVAKSNNKGFTVQIDCTDEKVRTAIEAAIKKAIEGV